MSEDQVRSEPRRRNCTLIVTHRCNLNCTYCYEKTKDSRSMSYAVAKGVVEHEFEYALNSLNTDEILFDFLGGEPFLEFGTIQRLSEWTWSEVRSVPYFFSATTNGTLLDNGTKKWLRKNSDRFKVVLSLDGIMSAQEINRPGSFNSIDLDFFKEVYPEQYLKMTVSPEAVCGLSAEVIELVKRGFKVAPSFAYGAAWTLQSLQEYRRQLRLLAQWFLENKEFEPIPQFVKPLPAIFNDGPLRRMCGVGSMMATYDVDGAIYPCHLFIPWISERSASLDAVWESGNLCDTRCYNCSYVRLCKHCYGFNFKESGKLDERSSIICHLTQIEIQTLLWFRATYLGQKVRNGISLTDDELVEAKAVLYLVENPPKTLS